ncbi:hypothetical protein JTE90_010090 [Oedothorax gibbosus]|uniref:Uncharacterized protein n=1 Tax=Oedothorax gibbosus TaxID=931172 RepID=A0AAV6U600_9ARAC|nr:hypothetical protein JTE90_010090 [Oedothorax gibbosus]
MAPTKVSQSRRVMASFHSQLARHKHKSVYCCLCHAEVTVGCFVSHVQEKHGVSCATSCAFFYGQFRWQKGDVVRDLRVAHHRKRCLESFLKTHRQAPRQCFEEVSTALPEGGETPISSSPSESDAYEFCPICYEPHRNGPRMNGRTRNELWESYGFYDSLPEDDLFFRDCGPKHVRFSEESGLGLCAHNIFQCFRLDEYAFYHVMVRACMWQDFREQNWSEVHFLPYSTLCDGVHLDEGEETQRDEGHIHHRHLMIAVKRERVVSFKEKWRRLTRIKRETVDTGGPVRRQQDKLCVSVHTASHLMYALVYVSRPWATCDDPRAMTLARGGGRGKDETGSHYWIFRELSSCAHLALAALWEKGHETLVSKRHRDSNLANFYEHVERANQHWQVRLKHLAMKEKNCVLPLAREYEMSDTWAEDCPVVYVYGRAKYLKCVPELVKLEYDAWLRHQLRTGNHFWYGLRDEYYVLEHYQTRCMNMLQQVVKQVVDGVQNTFARKEILLQSVIGQLKNEMNQHVAEKEDILRVLSTTQGDLAESQKHNEAVVLERGTARKGEAKAQKRIEALVRKLGTTRKDVAKAQKRIRHLEAELKSVAEERLRQSEERLISEQ